ncbi:hypothetical protein F5887DRAFT_1289009 [Amanita rubescens]|nr:hypothetical protein F5887DRAFT_1289009 [Amanita rubescens]
MPADRRTSSTTSEQQRRRLRLYGQVASNPRRVNGRLRLEYQTADPSPETLQLQQRADYVQLELERIKKAVELQEHADQLQLELERTKKELSLTKEEFEMDGAFGNKANVVSEADIITKVDSLNSRIHQLASAVADAHLDNAIQLSENQPSDNTKSFFGESLCNLVADAKQNSTQSRILASLQACMNHFCVQVLSSEFDSIVSSDKTQMLQKISDAIKASQPKAVSARWRALVFSDNEASQILKQNQESLLSLLIRRLSRLYGFPEKQLQSMFGEEIVNEMMDLRKMMHGSGDVKVLVPSPGSEFDPEEMLVEDPRSKTLSHVATAGPVMCTTSMGVARISYVRRRRENRWFDEEEHNVLSQANVVVGFDD